MHTSSCSRISSLSLPCSLAHTSTNTHANIRDTAHANIQVDGQEDSGWLGVMYVDDTPVAEFEILPDTNVYRLLLPELGAFAPTSTPTPPLHTSIHARAQCRRRRDTPSVQKQTQDSSCGLTTLRKCPWRTDTSSHVLELYVRRQDAKQDTERGQAGERGQMTSPAIHFTVAYLDSPPSLPPKDTSEPPPPPAPSPSNASRPRRHASQAAGERGADVSGGDGSGSSCVRGPQQSEGGKADIDGDGMYATFFFPPAGHCFVSGKDVAVSFAISEGFFKLYPGEGFFQPRSTVPPPDRPHSLSHFTCPCTYAYLSVSRDGLIQLT